MGNLRLGICLINVLTISILMASCSSGPNKWYKAGASSQNFEQDRLACEEVILSTGTTGLSSKTYSFAGCMEEKGWVILDSSTP
ncbi:MAG: hypothetical protein NPIRA04_14560 [Nitrospirales bacterium]|nr:MAG: hypothetical protein NPIRA04_14560 [Nitrospirales bacterium]